MAGRAAAIDARNREDTMKRVCALLLVLASVLVTRASAQALVSAKASRFDLSDLEPPAFGATTGQGEFKIFQDFLKSPKNVNGIAAALESAAAKAFKQ